MRAVVISQGVILTPESGMQRSSDIHSRDGDTRTQVRGGHDYAVRRP